MGRVQDKVAIVTGGASGIGRASAELLAEEGATVVVTDVQEELGRDVVAGIQAAGGNAVFIALDVTDEAQWQNTVSNTMNQFGGLHVLLNNAGICYDGPITRLSVEKWRRQQAINLEGVFLGVKHGIVAIRDSGGGSIINISSSAAIKAAANHAAYSATKSGVLAMTKAAAIECGQSRWPVRINAILPGMIDTPMWDAIDQDDVPEFFQAGEGDGKIDMQGLAEVLVPSGVLGEPRDIAKGVVFLASDDSRYITGVALPIDGGFAA